MASITLTVPNPDVPDALAAIQQIWRQDAIRLFFSGDAAAYAAATTSQQAKACVGAWLTVTTKNYRTTLNQLAVQQGTEPVIT